MSILYSSVITENISTYMYYRLAYSQSGKSDLRWTTVEFLHSFEVLPFFFHGTSLPITHTCRRAHAHTHTHTHLFSSSYIQRFIHCDPICQVECAGRCRGGGRVISAVVLYPVRSDHVERVYGWLCPFRQ